MSVVTTVTPLLSTASFTSPAQFVQRATDITGTVFADEPGTLEIQQSGDGTNWDQTTTYAVPANNGVAFEVPLYSQWWRIVYVNGSTAQTVFRLFADPRDPYGDFIAASTTPSAGGAWAVLQAVPNGPGYTYVGRFDGADGWSACQGAALYAKQSAKYAAFQVDTATVSDETIMSSTEHTPDSF